MTNNQAEYKGLLTGLEMAQSLEVKYLQVYTDSQVVTNQFSGEYETREAVLEKYLARVRMMVRIFDFSELTVIPREENDEADSLSKHVMAKGYVTLELTSPNQGEEVMASADSRDMELDHPEDWVSKLYNFLQTREISDGEENRRFKQKAAHYTIANSA